MKQFQIGKACHALRRLSEVALPPAKAYSIYLLMKKLDEPFSFYLEREKRIIEKYQCEIEPSGMAKFETTEDQQKFGLEMSELSDMEVEITFSEIEVSFEELGGRMISPNDIYALEGFVRFTG